MLQWFYKQTLGKLVSKYFVYLALVGLLSLSTSADEKWYELQGLVKSTQVVLNRDLSLDITLVFERPVELGPQSLRVAFRSAMGQDVQATQVKKFPSPEFLDHQRTTIKVQVPSTEFYPVAVQTMANKERLRLWDLIISVIYDNQGTSGTLDWIRVDSFLARIQLGNRLEINLQRSAVLGCEKLMEEANPPSH